MKKIKLLAYLNKNFGDDMLVYVTCKFFCNEIFEIEASSEYVDIFKDIDNLNIIRISWFRKILNRLMQGLNCERIRLCLIKDYKAVVYVIGALFDDNDEWNAQIKKRGLKKVKNGLFKYSFNGYVPFFLLGCNMTRVQSDKYISQMCYMFEGLKDVCFRDKYSYNLFRRLENVRYAPDIVLNYQCVERKKENLVLISVWGPLTCSDRFPQWKWAVKYWYSYKMFIVELVSEFLKIGNKVVLLSLCNAEGDMKAIDEVIMTGGFEDKVNVHLYNGNIKETISLFETAEFVIGTRFHSVIMAINARCKFFPIIYESKTQQLLEDINYIGEYAHIEKPLNYDVNSVMNNYYNQKINDYTEIKRAANSQYEFLKEYLEMKNDF